MKKYSIGFLASVFLCSMALVILYDYSYHSMRNRETTEQYEAATKEEAEGPVAQTEGNAIKNEGYYLKNKDGYVIVYLSDGQTVYEYTNIKLSSLPEGLQEEIEEGKRMETVEEIYGFLENYTS